MADFADWLDRELRERGMKPKHLADRIKRGANSIQNILKRERNVGPEIARDIAREFGYPQYFVFYQAGLLTELPPDLGSHPVKASIAHEVMDEEDDARLRAILENVRLWRRMASADGPPAGKGTRRAENSRLPLAK